uniref:phage head spike fiber domain-containing protein n=1 Tax=Pontiella sp. TaxID=2837462 RepID=UPI003564CA06
MPQHLFFKTVFSISLVAGGMLPLRAESTGNTILECTFEGPYYQHGTDTIQNGCINNYEWGKKDMSVTIDRPADGSGASQRFDIRGISSGAMQYFVTGFAIKRGYYYQVSFRAKGELDGNASAIIRKIGKPWKTYIPGLRFTPEKNWKSYSFTGKAPTDVDQDIALTFGSGALGQLWIDDIRIDVFQEAPDSIRINRNPLVHGNLMPRSSCEGNVDYLWTSGIYAGPDGEWEDPQIHRAPGGKVGQYAMAIPTARTEGTVFCRSFWLPVAAGHPYTFSADLKGSKAGATITMQIFTRQGAKNLGARRIRLTENWQRFSVTSQPIPDEVTDVYISFSASENQGTLFVDGTQLEAGTDASAYAPAYPCEIYADTSGHRSNIFFWDEPLAIRIRAAGAQIGKRGRTVKTRVLVTAFPDIPVMDKVVDLPLNQDYPLAIDSTVNGLFRVRFEPVDAGLAAPQEILLARLPRPREVGRNSSFGTHITVRPFFIDYAKSIGMKWTRFHDASLITKWKHAESEQGHYRYGDEQVDAIVAAGMNILGLPDYPP